MIFEGFRKGKRSQTTDYYRLLQTHLYPVRPLRQFYEMYFETKKKRNNNNVVEFVILPEEKEE